MLEHPTIDQLRALKLDGMADAFVELQSQDRAKDLSHAEWLALLIDREAPDKPRLWRHSLSVLAARFAEATKPCRLIAQGLPCVSLRRLGHQRARALNRCRDTRCAGCLSRGRGNQLRERR